MGPSDLCSNKSSEKFRCVFKLENLCSLSRAETWGSGRSFPSAWVIYSFHKHLDDSVSYWGCHQVQIPVSTHWELTFWWWDGCTRPDNWHILGCSMCDGQQSSVTTEWAVPHGSLLRSDAFPGCCRSLSRDMNTQPRTGEMTPGTRHKQRRGGMCREETAHAERRLPQSSRLTLPHLLPLLQATPHHPGLDKRSCI